MEGAPLGRETWQLCRGRIGGSTQLCQGPACAVGVGMLEGGWPGQGPQLAWGRSLGCSKEGLCEAWGARISPLRIFREGAFCPGPWEAGLRGEPS